MKVEYENIKHPNPDYDDLLWYIRLGIEMGIIDKTKIKITIS